MMGASGATVGRPAATGPSAGGARKGEPEASSLRETLEDRLADALGPADGARLLPHDDQARTTLAQAGQSVPLERDCLFHAEQG